MIGWMLFYVLAIPAFSFFLPLYSFWRMDDFSWGQTRVVLGESGKKMIVHVCITLISCSDITDMFQDEGKFDPRSIPLKSWNDYVSLLHVTSYKILTYTFRKTSSGIKNLIIALAHGYQQRSKTKDMQNHGQHLYTAARRTTNQEVSHQRLLNVECTLLDTSLVAIPLNPFSTQWQKLHHFSHHSRVPLPTT